MPVAVCRNIHEAIVARSIVPTGLFGRTAGTRPSRRCGPEPPAEYWNICAMQALRIRPKQVPNRLPRKHHRESVRNMSAAHLHMCFTDEQVLPGCHAR